MTSGISETTIRNLYYIFSFEADLIQPIQGRNIRPFWQCSVQSFHLNPDTYPIKAPTISSTSPLIVSEAAIIIIHIQLIWLCFGTHPPMRRPPIHTLRCHAMPCHAMHARHKVHPYAHDTQGAIIMCHRRRICSSSDRNAEPSNSNPRRAPPADAVNKWNNKGKCNQSIPSTNVRMHARMLHT